MTKGIGTIEVAWLFWWREKAEINKLEPVSLSFFCFVLFCFNFSFCFSAIPLHSTRAWLEFMNAFWSIFWNFLAKEMETKDGQLMASFKKNKRTQNQEMPRDGICRRSWKSLSVARVRARASFVLFASRQSKMLRERDSSCCCRSCLLVELANLRPMTITTPRSCAMSTALANKKRLATSKHRQSQFALSLSFNFSPQE